MKKIRHSFHRSFLLLKKDYFPIACLRENFLFFPGDLEAGRAGVPKSPISLADVGSEEFFQKLTSRISEMVSAKISQGKAGKHNFITVEKNAIFILWTLIISEIYGAGFETVILHKHMDVCNCLELRIFSNCMS